MLTTYTRSYIHGGAWRDPIITQTSFAPTIETLSSNIEYNTVLSSISAFASLDYRLSAHPSHPQDATSTPANELRNAKHPDHLLDIKSGIHFLQEKYAFGSNYILIGHSCGATLALQTVMGNSMVAPAVDIPLQPPKGVAGVCGIYDIPLMLENNRHPAYREFVAGAFGDESALWERISPSVRVKRDRQVLEGIVVCLAYSLDDELIDKAQVRSLGLRDVLVLEGRHDEIWRGGIELAKVVSEAVNRTVKRVDDD